MTTAIFGRGYQEEKTGKTILIKSEMLKIGQCVVVGILRHCLLWIFAVKVERFALSTP
jgi:hypothetical protein